MILIEDTGEESPSGSLKSGRSQALSTGHHSHDPSFLESRVSGPISRSDASWQDSSMDSLHDPLTSRPVVKQLTGSQSTSCTAAAVVKGCDCHVLVSLGIIMTRSRLV